jgi:hypothetical protein
VTRATAAHASKFKRLPVASTKDKKGMKGMKYIVQPRGPATSHQIKMRTPAALKGANDPASGILFGIFIKRTLGRTSHLKTQLPEGAAQLRRTESRLVIALPRAFRWRHLLKSGDFVIIAELAKRERIAPSYMTRLLRLTLLASDLVEKNLDGRQEPGFSLNRFAPLGAGTSIRPLLHTPAKQR